MAAEVGKQNEVLSGDTCDVAQIQDEDLLRKMWQTTEDFGRKKEIRARMYKLREQRLREFYTTGEVLKDVQSVDPGVPVSIREETPKRGGMHYRQLVVGELRGDVENTTTATQHIKQTSSSSSSTTVHRTTDNTATKEIDKNETSLTFTSRLPRLTTSSSSHNSDQQVFADGSEQMTSQVERQISNTDTKIMSELQKLDTYLSTTGVETPTPTSEKDLTNFDRGILSSTSMSTSNKNVINSIKEGNAKIKRLELETGDEDGTCNKTVIQEYHLPGSDTTPEIHSVVRQTESNWESEDGTSKSVSCTSTSSYSMESKQRRISTDVSPSHETFARSLRSSPERRMYDSSSSTRSSSKTSLDATVGRKSPERRQYSTSPTRSPRPNSVEQQSLNSRRVSPEKDIRASPPKSQIDSSRNTSEVHRVSTTRTTREETNNIRSSPDRRTGSINKPADTENKSSKTEAVTTIANRRSSQTSPTRQSPSRSSATNSPTRDLSSLRGSPTRKTSNTVNENKISERKLQASPTRQISTRKVSKASDSREITLISTECDETKKCEMSSRRSSRTSPTRQPQAETLDTSASDKVNDYQRNNVSEDDSKNSPSSCSPTNVNTNTNQSRLASTLTNKERRKLSSASSRASAKRAGTPGASPTSSPTRKGDKEKDDIVAVENDESDNDNITKETEPSVFSDSSEDEVIARSNIVNTNVGTIEQSHEVCIDTTVAESMLVKETVVKDAKQILKISDKGSEVNNDVKLMSTKKLVKETVDEKRASTVEPLEEQDEATKLQLKSAPEENDFKASSLIQMFSKKCVENETTDASKRRINHSKLIVSNKSDSSKSNTSQTLGKNTTMEKEVGINHQVNLNSSEKNNLQQLDSDTAMPSTTRNKNSTYDGTNSPRSLQNAVTNTIAVTSEGEKELEMTPCEPNAYPTKDKTKKATNQNRTARRRSRDFISDDDTSGRESSTSPVRRQVNRQHTLSTKTQTHESQIAKSSHTRPTKLPVSSNKLDTSVDRCCARQHDTTKPWRQSPSSTQNSPTNKAMPVSLTPVSGLERKPETSSSTRRRPASRSPSTSPDRPHAAQSRVGRKSPPEKKSSPVSPSTKDRVLPKQKPETLEDRRLVSNKPRNSKMPDTLQKATPAQKVKAIPTPSPTKAGTPSSRAPGRIQSPTKSRLTTNDKTEKDALISKKSVQTSSTSSQRVDVVRKVQASQVCSVPSYARPTSRHHEDNKTPTLRVTRVQQEPPRNTSSNVSRLPTSTKSKPIGTTKPQPVRTESNNSMRTKISCNNTSTKEVSTNLSVRSDTKTIAAKHQNSTQVASRKQNLNTTKMSLKKLQTTVPTSGKTSNQSLKSNPKTVENGRGQVESEDDLESIYSTEEDETVTELEEVRFSSHTVDDTEDEDFKARVAARGASLKPATDIVLLRSSRESSPDAALRTPRYADHVSEPDTDTDMQQKREVTPLNVVVRTGKSEQITDLDESGEDVDPSLLSVADRVCRFLSPGDLQVTPTAQKKVPVLTDSCSPSLDSPSAVRRAKAMFETIANSPIEAILNKQCVPDILSRPSIFDDPNRNRSPSVHREDVVTKQDDVMLVNKDLCDVKQTQETKFIEANLRTADTSVLDESMEHLLDSEEHYSVKKENVQHADGSKFDTFTKKSTQSTSLLNKKSSNDTERRSQSPQKTLNLHEKVEDNKFVSTATFTRSKPDIQRRDSDLNGTEKPRATVAPTQQTATQKKNTTKRAEPKFQVQPGGKFGVTLRQTTVTSITKTATLKSPEQKKSTVTEGTVIEEITDINTLEIMLEKATDYDNRRRLRAQIREVRRLGPAASAPAQRKSSPTRPKQEKEESVRRPCSSSSPTRRTSDVSLRQSPNRATDTPRQSPCKTNEVLRQSPERRVSSPSKEPTRKTSGTVTTKRQVPRDEEDGNCMSSTFIRQASKKFEDEGHKSSTTSTTARDEGKFATFTRQSSSKKIAEDERRSSRDETNKFNTFTRSSSNNKMVQSVPSNVEQGTEKRKSSKSEITIELATSGAPTGSKAPAASSPRKPSLTSTTTREANPTDPITSSYGVGPTDESGRPLFGLRALRRSQQQEPGSVVIEQQPTTDTTDIKEVKDSSGRPLFGLRAIKREGSPRTCDQSPGVPRGHSSTTPSVSDQEDSPRPHTMPERAPSNGQLRDLVQRHEQQAARSSPGSTTSPSQKPRAKLRDSFITQENKISTIKTSKEEALSSSSDRSNALRSIIQKHENITENEQQSTLIRKDSSRIEKNSYVNSPAPDDSERASPSRTETESPLPAAEPSSRRTSESTFPEQTRRPGILKKPRDSPERSSTLTSNTAVSTATINLRKVDAASVSKIIEDTRRSSVSRSPPDGSISTSLELESPRAVAKITQRSNSSVLDKCRASPERGDFDEEKVITDEDGGETRIRKTHREQVDDSGNSKSFTRTTTVSQRSNPQHGAEQRFTSSTTKVSQRTSTRGGEQPAGKPDHSIARVGRSGSVKALQQRFQQAADSGSNISNSSPKTRSYQKAGLIFRTNSFQHTNGCGPDLTQGNRSKEGSPHRDEESEGDGERRSTSESTTRTSVTMKLIGTTPTSSPKSFIGNETRVTGVQDILTRMREADHEEVAPGTSEDDREARALLNKFLGAQVLMQGMEPLIAAQSPSLVSQVERNRIVCSSSSKESTVTDGDELENIWDEKRLRQLLDASDDYDSRRKIRGRLRVVMAENKVTTDVESRECDASQVSSSDGVLNTVREKSESTVISTSDNSTRKEVQMKTSSVSSSMTSTTRVSKAAPPSKLQMSPFAKFKQLDEQNSSPSPSSPQTPGGSNVPLFKFTDAGLSRSASNVKEKLLYWCQVKTKEYKDLKIENFSTSWSNGLAFCALIHHFGPENFDYYVLRPEKRRKNFELAFKVADEKFDIAPLLDVEDMVMMKKPDWKCVFTYVQSIYRRFKDELD